MSLTKKRLPAHPLTLCKFICIEVKHDSITTQTIAVKGIKRNMKWNSYCPMNLTSIR